MTKIVALTVGSFFNVVVRLSAHDVTFAFTNATACKMTSLTSLTVFTSTCIKTTECSYPTNVMSVGNEQCPCGQSK